MELMKRVKIIVNGDVQGVFYRYYAKKEAKKLKLLGWCRNEADGSVFIIVEGDSQSVDKFIKWSKIGSPLASVDEVLISEEKPTGQEKEFEIR